MRYVKKFGRATLFVAIFVAFAVSANAQTISNSSAVNVSLAVTESLTVSATPSSVTLANYSVTNGTASASSPIVVTTTGNLASGHAWILTAAYFSSASAALTGPQNVPSSDLFVVVDGAAIAPCTASPGGQVIPGVVAGAVCASSAGNNPSLGAIGSQQNPPAGAYSQVDTVQLSLAGAPNLPPGSYTGVLTFIAGAF
jgi:hypothetical protein